MGKMMRNLVGVKPDLESADLKRYVSRLFRCSCTHTKILIFTAGANNTGSGTSISAPFDSTINSMGV